MSSLEIIEPPFWECKRHANTRYWKNCEARGCDSAWRRVSSTPEGFALVVSWLREEFPDLNWEKFPVWRRP